ncbi:O-methyltransferase [Hoeflea phototrophica DFL-43]|jgi:demethylspheroidene O-methyltransferase|uniref:O-methyltransferase n=1 Tax=Hoeflea phototrophica (strain DSM 17068 / NCIMB 14078 / DFL-43) TaxID=411684 RepID=A9DA51_HOEPD|nr:methyltransferase [Hoeflea phototrophica]EDQ32673.1 O-methyltransferase [Hoeflea phototrophica DFL-43]
MASTVPVARHGRHGLAPQPEHQPRPDWRSRLQAWRARLVARPGFRRLAQRLPLSSSYARARENDLFALVSGFVQSQILFTSLKTGLIDALADGPVTMAELASRTGFPQDRLDRLVQAAQSVGLVATGQDGFVTLGDHGAIICSDEGLRAMINHHALLYRDLNDPVALFDGSYTDTEMRRLWSYAGSGRESAVEPEDAAAYSALMAASQSMLSDEILDAYDFGRHTSLIDIGGGEGAFLTAVAKRYSGLRMSLFDLPPVAKRARDRFAAHPLGQCPRCYGGSFLDDTLPRGHDCVSLVRVLFDHEDAVVLRLLRNVRAAMEPGQTLVIAEPMAGNDSRGQRYATAYFGVYVMAMGSGRCRTPDEIGALAKQAGFSRFDIRPCRSPLMATIVVVFP